MSDETPQEIKPSGVIQGEKGAETAQVWISGFLVVVLGAITFSPAFSIPFHGEELGLFVDTPALHRAVSFPEASDELPGAPLTLLSYGLNYGWPPSPSVALHGFSVLLHLINAVLVFLLARALLPKGTPPFLALSAGAVFVVFVPLAETVCYLPLRPAVLATTFGLLSILAVLRAVRDAELHPGWLGLSLALLLAAAGASHIALCLAPALVVAGALRRGTGIFTSHGAVTLGVVAAVLLFWLAVAFGGAGWPLGRFEPTLLMLGTALGSLIVPALLYLLGRPQLRVGVGIAVAVLVLVTAYFSNGVAAAMSDPVTWWGGKTPDLPEGEEISDAMAEQAATYDTYQARAIIAAANQAADVNARAGVLEQARVLLRNAVGLTPDNLQRKKLLGNVLQETGRGEEAVTVLQDVLRADPHDQETSLRLASLMEARARGGEDPDALLLAIDYYDHAAGLGPLPGDMGLRAAMTHAALGDVEAALPALRATVGNNDDHPLAPALKQFEAMAAAMADLRKREQEARAKDPRSVEALLARAELAAIRGHAMESFYLLDLALLREPGNPRAWGQMGLTCARMDNVEGFLAQWADSANVDLSAWQGLAGQCAAVGLWEPALAYLEHAAARYPGAPLPRVGLADIALQIGQGQRAQALLEQAAEAHPERPEPWLKLADMAIAAKNMAPVARWLAEAEARGAAPEDIESRRAQAGVTTQDAQRPPRTIIR